MIRLLTDRQAEAHAGHRDEVLGAAHVPSAVFPRLHELVAAHGDVAVMRDWEGCLVAEAGHEVYALTEDGRIGLGGVNQPRYAATLGDLCPRPDIPACDPSHNQ